MLNYKSNERCGDMYPSEITYESDLNLWLEKTIVQLRMGDLSNLDTAHLIEELEGLAGRDRRELKQRLTTLFEHLLKRCYVKSSYDYAGWVRTINRTRLAIRDILQQSPSLRTYGNRVELLQGAYEDALRLLRSDPDYDAVNFPDRCPFSNDLEDMITIDFWEA
jgi:hypothetical protein